MAHWLEAQEALNKEEQNHHIMRFARWMCHDTPYAYQAPNTDIVKNGQKARLIWGGTSKRFY